MKANVLVLGATGMLGSMVHRHLNACPGLIAQGTSRNSGDTQYTFFDADEFIHSPQNFATAFNDTNYVINCIGVTKPNCRDDDEQGVTRAITTNALFPHVLAQFLSGTHTKVLHVSSDGVFSGDDQQYDEAALPDARDVYGKSKSLGEVRSPHVLTVRCSVIGPDKLHGAGLISWFLQHPSEAQVPGFIDHVWSGATSYQFASLCETIIVAGVFDRLAEFSHVYHFAPNPALSKYETLRLLNTAYKRNYSIVALPSGTPGGLTRILTSRFELLREVFPPQSWERALNDLVRASDQYFPELDEGLQFSKSVIMERRIGGV